VQDFKKLAVWRKGHELTLKVFGATATFPTSELYGLTSQIRRSASSVPANIAEGCGRGSNPELSRFLTIAAGSASELEYHLLLAVDLKYLPQPAYATLLQEVTDVKRMLAGLQRRLRATLTTEN
jgi:four helix bundle protein